jgi:hypothetical protein
MNDYQTELLDRIAETGIVGVLCADGHERCISCYHLAQRGDATARINRSTAVIDLIHCDDCQAFLGKPDDIAYSSWDHGEEIGWLPQEV